MKLDSDQQTIGETSTSGIESEQGDIQMDLTLKPEEIPSFLIILKKKLKKESEHLSKNRLPTNSNSVIVCDYTDCYINLFIIIY